MRRGALLTLALLAACAETSERDPGGGADAALDDGGAAKRVEVGTGLERFEAITEDQTVELVRGPQGGSRYMGYHVWMGARLRGYAPNATMVEVGVLDAATREVRVTEERITALEPDGDAKVVFGLAPRIDDCCAVSGRPILLRATIRDPDGLFGEDEIRVAGGVCLGLDGRPVCP